jgi:hypothetical protein
MNRKYWIHNQRTGLQEEALTFEDALTLQQNIKEQLPEHADQPELFVITVLVQNEDGTWTQSRADSNGDPLINS